MLSDVSTQRSWANDFSRSLRTRRFVWRSSSALVQKGKVRSKSDIDIAFLFDAPANILNLANTVNRLLQSDNADVVDLYRASPLLRYAVVRNGTVLYEREPGLFIRLFSLSYRMYGDTKKLRGARDRRIEQFLNPRGSA